MVAIASADKLDGKIHLQYKQGGKARGYRAEKRSPAESPDRQWRAWDPVSNSRLNRPVLCRITSRELTPSATGTTSMQPICLIVTALSLAATSVADTRCIGRLSTGGALVLGHVAARKPSVCEYLGIPYAAPPTGNLRFSPPKRSDHTGAFVAADKQGADCPQTTSSIFAYPNATSQYGRIVANFANSESNHTQSEDCLTLNIWSKASSDGQSKPVIVFFYGGSQFSSAQRP